MKNQLKITTWNVNGLRAAIRKGFGKHLAEIAPDVLLLQEVRATPDQLPKEWQNPAGWHVVWNPAQKPGYAGTAVWSRLPMDILGTGLADDHADEEGRVARARIGGAGGVEVASIYLPSGSSGEARQVEKERWMAMFRPWAEAQLKRKHPVILGGDLNIAITPRDIFHAKSNEETSGFLPHERQWMEELVALGWRDFVREDFDAALARGDRAAVTGRFGVEGEGIDPARHGPYSWWSNRGGARASNRGWRIDYLLGNAKAGASFAHAAIGRQAALEVSDHAPVSVVV